MEFFCIYSLPMYSKVWQASVIEIEDFLGTHVHLSRDITKVPFIEY